ncbi:MAG: FHA domain-containing protein [Bacteroides sp.]|nr:FHA domain-containing protein [Bacteroides sp.]
MEIIIGRHGTQRTPITDPTVSRQHCKLTINDDGSYTLENLSASGTKVDGQNIIRTTVTLNSHIQLGPTFSATLIELIGMPSSNSNAGSEPNSMTGNQPGQRQSAPPKQDVKIFNISHLKHVWDEFNQTNIGKANEQRKVNLTRTGLGIFTMCAMPTIFFFGPVGYALTAIGVLGNLYSFVGLKNAETPEDRQRRQDAFDDAWVCPNPTCGKTIPAKNYRLLVRNHQCCPYCKCKYIEK